MLKVIMRIKIFYSQVIRSQASPLSCELFMWTEFHEKSLVDIKNS